MATYQKYYCCCCIPVRFGVFLISLLALANGGYQFYVNAIGQKYNTTTNRIIGYASLAIYAILGITGIIAVIRRSPSFARFFAGFWWFITLVTTVLSVLSLVLYLTSQKDNVRSICRDELPEINNSPPSEKEVDDCYKYGSIMLGVALAVEVLIMCLCGWVADSYKREVASRKAVRDFELQHGGGYSADYKPH